MSVKPKKHLGQHFLKDENIAKKIGDTLTLEGYNNILEIGPGMGVLTKYLVAENQKIQVVEFDSDAVEFLKVEFGEKKLTIHDSDFLKWDCP